MTDRLREAVLGVVRALIADLRQVPELAVLAQWKYRVTEVIPGHPVLVSGTAISEDCPWPDLAQIKLWPGPSGGYAVPSGGSIVLVRFNDGNPRDPAIVGLDPDSLATLTTFGAPFPLAEPLVQAPWGVAIEAALAELATQLTSAASFAQVNTAGSTLTGSLAAPPITPPAFTEVIQAQ